METSGLTQDTRHALHAMINSFLAQQHLLTDHLNMRPTAATVYLTIVRASASQHAQPFNDQAGGRPTKARSRARSGAISRRALATATGFPRETVRRIVLELINAGQVVDLGHAGVRLDDCDLSAGDRQERIQDWAAELTRLCHELTDLGMLGVRQDPGDAARHA